MWLRLWAAVTETIEIADVVIYAEGGVSRRPGRLWATTPDIPVLRADRRPDSELPGAGITVTLCLWLPRGV